MPQFRYFLPFFLALCVLLGAGQARAQVQYGTTTGTNPLPVGSTYSQTFDTLNGSAGTWTDNSTLYGWYSNQKTYNSSNGGSANGYLYNYGTSTGSSTNNRALGSLASPTTNSVIFGVEIKNTTQSTLYNIQVGFTGEEWRSSSAATASVLNFSYSNTAQSLTDTTGFTNLSALNYTAPTHDGDYSFNGTGPTQALSATLNGVTLAPGKTLWLRWTNTYEQSSGNGQGLAIDNFSFTATPEPSGIVSMGIGLSMAGLGAWARRRRRLTRSSSPE